MLEDYIGEAWRVAGAATWGRILTLEIFFTETKIFFLLRDDMIMDCRRDNEDNEENLATK